MMDRQREAKNAKGKRSILLEDTGLLGRLQTIHQKVDYIKVEGLHTDHVLRNE